MSLEIFKTIPGFPDYEVSTWGRVFSKKTGRFLKQEEHYKGYLRVDLFDVHGERKHFKVHRLVAEAFIPNPLGKDQINHKDGNNTNNSVTNLEWVTCQENMLKAKELRDLRKLIESKDESFSGL